MLMCVPSMETLKLQPDSVHLDTLAHHAYSLAEALLPDSRTGKQSVDWPTGLKPKMVTALFPSPKSDNSNAHFRKLQVWTLKTYVACAVKQLHKSMFNTHCKLCFKVSVKYSQVTSPNALLHLTSQCAVPV